MKHIEKTTPCCYLYFYGDRNAKKGYVGMTMNPSMRWGDHRRSKQKQDFFRDCTPKFEILESGLDWDSASEREIALIKQYLLDDYDLCNDSLRPQGCFWYGDVTTENDLRYSLQRCAQNQLDAYLPYLLKAVSKAKKKATKKKPQTVTQELIETLYEERFDEMLQSDEYCDARNTFFGCSFFGMADDTQYYQFLITHSQEEVHALMEKWFDSPEYKAIHEKFFGKDAFEKSRSISSENN